MLDHPALLWFVLTKESDKKEVSAFLVQLSDYEKYFQHSTSLVQTHHSEDTGRTDWLAGLTLQGMVTVITS